MDSRWVGESLKSFYAERFNAEAMTIEVQYQDAASEEESCVDLPAKYEVCATCEGRGSHVNPHVDDCGISAEEFAEDPDFAEAYRTGLYDVPCYECDGKRVVPRVDEERINQSGSAQDRIALAQWKETLKEEDAYRRERESERRYGA